MLNVTRATFCSLLWLTFIGYPFRGVAEEPVTESAASDAAAAITACDEAGLTIEKWRRRVEGGEVVRPAELRQLQASLQGIYKEAGKILEVNQRRRRLEREASNKLPSDHRQSAVWVEQMRTLGVEGAAKRAAAVAEIRTALESNDERRQYEALRTLEQVADVNFDKAQFRPLILPLFKTAEGHMLVSAANALNATDRRSEDVELIYQVWERRSPPLDDAISMLLFRYNDGRFTGRAEEIMIELLAGWEDDDCRAALGGLWGAEVTDRLAGRVIEMADDPRWHDSAIYFGLSTLKVKNEAVVDKLIETLADSDWNNWDRALWGLGFGVPDELKPKVVGALTDFYSARSDPRGRDRTREIIREYGGDATVDALPE